MAMGPFLAAELDSRHPYLPLWLRLYGATGTAILNVEVRTTPPED